MTFRLSISLLFLVTVASADVSARQAAARPLSPAAAPPATEVYLAPIRLDPDAPRMGPARNASENPNGYDNQPSFGPDGRTLLFTSNRDGKQTDIYFLELATRQIRQFTSTPESEYSPTMMPADAGVSVIRVEGDGTQRVWRFPDGGEPSVVLPSVKPAGYHAWIDANRIAVFVLGQPATLQVADVAAGDTETVATDIGRALATRPCAGTLSFVHHEGSAWIVKEYDPATRAVRSVVPALEGSEHRDAAWGPDGTLFMTRGGEVHFWRPGQDGWRLLAAPGIGTLSRLAVSRNGRWMALVAAEAHP